MAVKLTKAASREFIEMMPGVKASRDVDPSISDSMGCVVYEFDNCNFEWTTLYDEYIYLLDGGPFVIETKEGTMTLDPGDSIWMPYGTWHHYRLKGN